MPTSKKLFFKMMYKLSHELGDTIHIFHQLALRSLLLIIQFFNKRLYEMAYSNHKVIQK
jgi:hypothetical protein